MKRWSSYLCKDDTVAFLHFLSKSLLNSESKQQSSQLNLMDKRATIDNKLQAQLAISLPFELVPIPGNSFVHSLSKWHTLSLGGSAIAS